MNVSKGQIWVRKKYTDNPIYYPEGGWEIMVVEVKDSIIKYKIIMYENKKVSNNSVIEKSVDEFLSMYDRK